MFYENRNLDNIEKLAPNTKQKAKEWHAYCKSRGINILIYETLRTVEQQRKNVTSGASQTMKSYHLVGQALDFVPVNSKGETLWNDYESDSIKEAVSFAKKLGFEWGGDWKSFVDKPHLQYNYKGYGTDKVLEIKVSKQEGDEDLLKERFEPKEHSELNKGQLNMLNRLIEIGAIAKDYKPSLQSLETMSIIDSAFKNSGFYDFAKRNK